MGLLVPDVPQRSSWELLLHTLVLVVSTLFHCYIARRELALRLESGTPFCVILDFAYKRYFTRAPVHAPLRSLPPARASAIPLSAPRASFLKPSDVTCTTSGSLNVSSAPSGSELHSGHATGSALSPETAAFGSRLYAKLTERVCGCQLTVLGGMQR